ncbi:MAG: M28 family peptidase, partial [Candidatus Heimdallarchaeota archaeon]|nr:M28 family peptidase [Candidatus Heimdallarchaeota archaeon]
NEFSLKPFHGDRFELYYEMDTEFSDYHSFYNLIGVVPGTNPEGIQPVLIGAHYDSVIDAPCSDDNATAVAVTLAAAEYFMEYREKRDIIIALFDAEEPPWFCGPAMGSTRFYEDHCNGLNFEAVIILDLIGHIVEIPGLPFSEKLPGIRNLIFALGSESRRTVAFSLERAAKKINGLNIFPTLNSYVGDKSDHHAFRLGGEPYLFLSCAQGKYYHHPEDNMEWINFRKVRYVYKLVVEIVKSFDLLSEESDLVDEEHNQAKFEIRMIKRALRWMYPLFIRYLKIKHLRNREDINRLAGALTPSFMDGVISMDIDLTFHKIH